jgi:hypothetical protein
VTREWFHVVAAQLFDPEAGFFRQKDHECKIIMKCYPKKENECTIIIKYDAYHKHKTILLMTIS